MYKVMTKEQVLEAIKERKGAGLPLNISSLTIGRDQNNDLRRAG